MNLEFNIAVHVLTYLTKHAPQQYTSSELAENVCVNAVQLRRVMQTLIAHDYVDVRRGKYGGYQARANTREVSLGELYDLFHDPMGNARVFTGNEQNKCKISSQIGGVMSQHFDGAHQMLKAYYDTICIQDVLTSIVKEDIYEKI